MIYNQMSSNSLTCTGGSIGIPGLTLPYQRMSSAIIHSRRRALPLALPQQSKQQVNCIRHTARSSDGPQQQKNRLTQAHVAVLVGRGRHRKCTILQRPLTTVPELIGRIRILHQVTDSRRHRGTLRKGGLNNGTIRIPRL